MSIVSSVLVQNVHFGSPMSIILYNKVFAAKNFMIKSAMEPLKCTVFGDFKSVRKYLVRMRRFKNSSYLRSFSYML